MGLPVLPGPLDGGLPFIVINTIMSVAFLRKKLQSVLQSIGATAPDRRYEDDDNLAERRRVSIFRYGSLCRNKKRCLCAQRRRGGSSGGSASAPAPVAECSVCLSKFEAEEEVSELSCRHFFHSDCLKKWFDNHHLSCPLCRSVS